MEQQLLDRFNTFMPSLSSSNISNYLTILFSSSHLLVTKSNTFSRAFFRMSRPQKISFCSWEKCNSQHFDSLLLLVFWYVPHLYRIRKERFCWNI